MDKLTKVRAEVERLHNEYRNKKGALYYRKALRTVLFFIDSMPKEPVSEDLEEVCEQLAENARKHKAETSSPFFSPTDYKQGVIDGVNWQKEQFEKNRLKHCNSITNEQAELEQSFIDQHLYKYQRMPTFLDAIEYGMRLQKQQLMAKAVDAVVKIDAGGYPYVDRTIELYDYDKDIPLAKHGDKVKVIVIKED